MNLPSTVRIGGTVFDIELDEKIISAGQQVRGMVEYNRAKITIDPVEQCEQMAQQTLMHEIVHALCFHFGLTKLNDDEDTVDTIAIGLYMLLKDNPNLMNDLNIKSGS